MKMNPRDVQGPERGEQRSSSVFHPRACAVRNLAARDLSTNLPALQTGQVAGVQLTLDVELPGGERMQGVSSERLALPHPFAPGHFVVGGAWVGRVDSIVHDITLAFDDGSIGKVPIGEVPTEEVLIAEVLIAEMLMLGVPVTARLPSTINHARCLGDDAPCLQLDTLRAVHCR